MILIGILIKIQSVKYKPQADCFRQNLVGSLKAYRKKKNPHSLIRHSYWPQPTPSSLHLGYLIWIYNCKPRTVNLDELQSLSLLWTCVMRSFVCVNSFLHFIIAVHFFMLQDPRPQFSLKFLPGSQLNAPKVGIMFVSLTIMEFQTNTHGGLNSQGRWNKCYKSWLFKTHVFYNVISLHVMTLNTKKHILSL